MNMYANSEFTKGTKAVEALKNLKEQYKYEGEALPVVQERVNDLIQSAQGSGFVPQLVVHSSWSTDDNGKFTEAAFTVRPTAKVCADAKNYKDSFHIVVTDKFYAHFVSYLALWADNYMLHSKYHANLNLLETVVAEALEAAEVPFKVHFKIGSGVLDVSDTEITFGISMPVIENLATSDLFYTLIPGNLEVVRAGFAEAIKGCAKPIDMVKLNNYILKSLGVYSRKSYKSLIRDNVTRKVEFSRVGTSYIDTPDYFAVIEKTAITPEDAAALTDAYVVENTTATSAEKAAGKTKVLVAFKVSPFNADGASVDVDIKSVPNVVKANA